MAPGGSWARGPPKAAPAKRPTPAAGALNCLIDGFVVAGYELEGVRAAVLKMQGAQNFGELCGMLEGQVASRPGWGLAHWAAHIGLWDAIGMLAELGEDLHRAADDGSTPAHVAAEANHAEALEALLAAGAALVAQGCDGGTPAQRAACANAATVLRAFGRGRCGSEAQADMKVCGTLSSPSPLLFSFSPLPLSVFSKMKMAGKSWHAPLISFPVGSSPVCRMPGWNLKP